MLIILKNKYHALNKRYFELELDHEEKELISSDDNEQENTILEICIQRSLELNLPIIDSFVAL